jgi:hypothetical protein
LCGFFKIMYRQLTKSDYWDRKLLICVKTHLRYVFLRPYTSYGTSSTQGYHGVFQGIMAWVHGLGLRV